MAIGVHMKRMKPSANSGDLSKSNGDRLLAGEDPLTIRPRDAHHWVGVYAEMIGFKTQLLKRVNEGLEGVSHEARNELQEDVDLIAAQMERYERRLRFWSRRASDLTMPSETPRR